MGSLALLARDLGIRVSGSDQNVYPPMSTQLRTQGIELMEGYEVSHLDSSPDLVVIGNAMTRGNPVVEYVLDRGSPIPLVHSFLLSIFSRENGFWRSPEPTAKPQPAACWRGFLRTSGWLPVF